MSSTIIIGGSTQVSFGNACVISAQWNFSPNQQDVFCLGSWSPDTDRTIFKPEMSVSLTLYSPGPVYNCPASTSCEIAFGINLSISPAGCSDVNVDISGSYLPTSYSYSKEDKSTAGQESWSLVQYQGAGLGSVNNLTKPKYILRGIAKGQTTDQAITGVTIDTVITSFSSGSVSAGQFGKSETFEYGVVTSVGGGSSNISAGSASGSAQIPYTPLYID